MPQFRLRFLLFFLAAGVAPSLPAADMYVYFGTHSSGPGLGFSIAHCSLTVVRVSPDGSFKIFAVGDIGHIPPNLQSGATKADPQLVAPRT